MQEAIFSFERTTGVVATINSEAGAKSGQLAEALAGGKKIVVCTIQTFPFALAAVQELAASKGKRFAVIADEAHSSQTGEAASKLKLVLSAEEAADVADGGEVSAEDVLAANMSARAGASGITYVAFTATPKAKTLELFGCRPDPLQPASSTNLPEAFHVYSMRQAIEEGFILDVLQNYTPYSLAFRLPMSAADLFCVLATGGSHSARALYTSNDRAVSEGLCSIIFTSVLDEGITHRPDLLNRMLTLHIGAMPKSARKGEGELNAAWAQDLANLSADLYDLLVVGLRRIAFVRAEQAAGRLPPPPRLADVAQFAEAASEGLGWPPGLLTQTLNTLQADAASDQLASDPIAFRLRALLLAQPGHRWVGTLGELERAVWAFSDGPHAHPNTNFKNALARVKGPLREVWGIEISDKRRNSARLKEIALTPKAP